MFKKLILVTSIATLMVGCNTDKVKSLEEKSDVITGQAESHFQKNELPEAKTPTVVNIDRIFIPSGSSNYVNPNRNGIEAEKIHIAFNKHFESVAEMAARITTITGVRLTLAPELRINSSSSKSSSTQSGAPGAPGAPGQSISLAGSSKAPNQNFPINYSGELKGLFNVLAAQFGIYVTWVGENQAKLYLHDTRSFPISALPGNLTMDSKIASNNGGQASVKVSDISVWKALDNTIKNMLSPKGRVDSTPSTGVITVTDTPGVLDRIGIFVSEQNKALEKMVLLNAKVYAIHLNDDEDYGLDWNAIYSNLGESAEASLANAGKPLLNASNLSLGIIGGNWDGSKLLLKALSERGKVTQVTSSKMLTLNNQPALFNISNRKGYLASSETTLNDTTATTSLKQETIETGFYLNMVPHVLKKSDLLLQFGMSISSLIALDPVTSGGSTIQTPDTTGREMLQRVRLQSGDTLVISGFDLKDINTVLKGVGKAENSWFGGSSSAQDGRTLLVVMIQPIVSGVK